MSPGNMRRLDMSEVGDVVILYPKDQRIIEDLQIQEIGRELFHLVEGEACTKILLSFAPVGWVASAFLGKMMTLDKKIKRRGGTGLALCSVRPEIYEVFAITRLDRLFHIFRDEEEALSKNLVNHRVIPFYY